FDVTAACVSHLEAIQTAAGYLALHPHYRAALICSSELTGQFLSYDIKNVRDLHLKVAGLTIGNAATCMLLRRTPFPGGGIRLMDIGTYTAPDHWELCQVPIGGTLVSSSVELMRLGKYIPPWATERLAALGLTPNDIDHYVFHQPSEIMVRKILDDFGVTYRRLLEERTLERGDKLVLGSAAAGYSMVFAMGEWTGSASSSSHESRCSSRTVRL